jgi:outer membrane receptor protein involved in Fe transport
MKAYLLAPVSITLLAMQVPVAAQSPEGASDQALPEVIVTATRRSERLQDVPLAISAYSQDKLTAEGIVGYEALAHETPGTIINRATANFNNFTVRGIATNGYNANLQSTVAIYIDELPISANGNSTILDPTLFDVERVEFLRGPQGTLFGSGSLAGAMRVLTKAPDLTAFDAAALVDFGLTESDSYRQRYNFMLNTPVVDDKLGFRFVGFYRNEDGYLYNAGTGIDDSNSLEDWGGRAIMLWEPTDRMSVRLMALHEDSDPADSFLTAPSLGREMRVSDRPDLFQANLDSYNATLTFDFDGASLISSSTLSNFDQLFFVDLAGTFGGTIAFALDALAYDDIFVQEMRLVSNTGGKWDYVLGGYYNYKRRDVDYNYRSSPEFLAARGITGLPDEYYQRFGSHFTTHETAGFATLTYHVNDQFWLTGGLRYAESDVQGFTEPGGYSSNYLTMALFGLSGPVTITPVAAATGVKGKESGPSYKVSASYKPSPDMTAYATISTGFRTPVVNARAGSVSTLDPTDIIIPFGADSDNLTNYELGLKGSWFDDKMSGDFSLYLIDWSDIQVQANRVSDSVQFATNIGEARSYGFEFSVALNPVPALTIGLNGSVNHAEVTQLTAAEAAISGAVKGARLAFPHFQGSLNVRYDFDLGANTRAFANAVVQHVGSFPNMFPNTPGRPTVPSATYGFSDSYENVNLAFGASRGKVATTLYVENLLDDHSITYIHPEAFIASRFGTLRPRTIGLRFDIRM